MWRFAQILITFKLVAFADCVVYSCLYDGEGSLDFERQQSRLVVIQFVQQRACDQTKRVQPVDRQIPGKRSSKSPIYRDSTTSAGLSMKTQNFDSSVELKV